MSYLDPKWRYHTVASHDDASAFRRRQQERMRVAREAATVAAEAEKERASKVRAISKRRAA